MEYIINNLQQPPPPPTPPPPSNDAAADRERLIAELDGMAQQREQQMRQTMMAERNARDLAAQSVATPAQQIIREFHTQQPIYVNSQPPPPPPPPPQVAIPVPTQPSQRQDYSQMMRDFGMTMQQLFLSQQQQVPASMGQRPPPDAGEDIPITYTNNGRPPPPPPPGREMVRSFGPARIPRERYAPFQGSAPSPASGGATAPMPMRRNPPPPPAPPRFPGRGQKLPLKDEDPKFTPFSGRSQRLPEEEIPATPSQGPPRPPKRKATDPMGNVKIPKTARFPGQGQRLPDQPRFAPFSGTGSRLPGESDTRANAIQRMREIAEQSRQRGRASEMVDRMGDLRRAVRRCGAQGDVVGAGKRKRETDTFEPNPRTRRGDRTAGPQRFTIAT